MLKFELYLLLVRNYRRFVIRYKTDNTKELHLVGDSFFYSTTGDSCLHYVPSNIVDLLGMNSGVIILDSNSKTLIFKSNRISFTISGHTNPILRLQYPLPTIRLIFSDGKFYDNMQNNIDILIRALNEIDDEDIYDCVINKNKILKLYNDRPMYDVSNLTCTKTISHLPLIYKIRIKIRKAFHKIFSTK